MFDNHVLVNISWGILITLLVVFFLLILSIISHGLTRYILTDRRNKARAFIADILVQEVDKPGSQDLEVLKPYAGKVVLLNELEAFTRRFKGEEWTQVRHDIAASFLLPRARQLATSASWIQRNFAARAFAMAPSRYDLEILLNLLDDPEFLVRSQAAKACSSLKSPEAVYKMIQHMSDELGYAHFYFRDMLLKMESREILGWIEDFGLTEKKRFTKIACLDLLSENSYQLTTNLLESCLKSEDDLIRYFATKVHARNPQKNSCEVLFNQIHDTDWKIREEAAYGLQYQYEEDVEKKLFDLLLEDPNWKVKIGAARSLIKRGPEAMKALESLDESKHQKAYQAYRYAMNFS